MLIKCRQGATSTSGSYSDKSGMDTAGSRGDSCEDGSFTAKKLQRAPQAKATERRADVSGCLRAAPSRSLASQQALFLKVNTTLLL